MNKKQWSTAAFGFLILQIIFIGLDTSNGFLVFDNDLSETGNICLDSELQDNEWAMGLLSQFAEGNLTQEEFNERYDSLSRLDYGDVMCIVRDEVYAPFVWLSFFLFILCMILGWLEPRKN